MIEFWKGRAVTISFVTYLLSLCGARIGADLQLQEKIDSLGSFNEPFGRM